MFYISKSIPYKVLTNHTVLPNVEMMAREFPKRRSKNGFSWVSINLQSKLI